MMLSKSCGIAGAILPALFLLSGVGAAHAGQCFTNGPLYQLESETVEWKMSIHSNENCVRGVRFSYIYNAEVSVVTPPKAGQVSLFGTGFSYTAATNAHGEDSFVVRINGAKKKTKGFSNIRVVVSVVDTHEALDNTYAHFAAKDADGLQRPPRTAAHESASMD